MGIDPNDRLIAINHSQLLCRNIQATEPWLIWQLMQEPVCALLKSGWSAIALAAALSSAWPHPQLWHFCPTTTTLRFCDPVRGLLLGSGSNDEPLGLINTPGIGTQSFPGQLRRWRICWAPRSARMAVS